MTFDASKVISACFCMKETAKTFYTQLAEGYAEKIRQLVPMYDDMVQCIVELLRMCAPEGVLDIGAGVGNLSQIILQNLPHVRITAVEASEEMAAAARQRFRAKADRVTIVQADILDLSPEVSFDVAFSNLVLHNIDEAHIWHGNTLTGAEIYGGLFQGAPALHDVILMNPPFGGKEGDEARTQFAYKTGSTQILFLQHVIDCLKPEGRCGIVMDEGVLFRTNETAFVQTKRKLLDDCDLWCIVSLPPGVFTSAGAGVKTNLFSR